MDKKKLILKGFKRPPSPQDKTFGPFPYLPKEAKLPDRPGR